MKQLDAGEHALAKIFCSDYEFEIPHYQRPYSWGSEQALQLLDDLEFALGRSESEPYFLGSIVLVKAPDDPHADVIDGQQRLTTLTLLLALIRDMTTDDDLRQDLGQLLVEPGSKLHQTVAKPRLLLREKDAAFFTTNVQTQGATTALLGLSDNEVSNDSQTALRDNASALRAKLARWPREAIDGLATMLVNRTFLVVVSTPDVPSAHRIFSVMNARGLDLSPADIFKATVIGSINDTDRGSYAEKWEDAEQDLGRDRFADLFLHIRMIFHKSRAQRELLIEFPEQVLNRYLPHDGADFVDKVVLPYAKAYGWIVGQDYTAAAGADAVNAWLRRLVQLDNNDWRPPALWALRHHGNDPEWLDKFFRRLERLAASMLVRRVYATPRAQRYAELLRQLEEKRGLESEAFDLSADEKQVTLDRLGGDVYLVTAIRKYVLLRIDETLEASGGAVYQHPTITVEHVLPQTPARGSNWMNDFEEDERVRWTHKLGNLLLLNVRKNAEAQNYDFDKKKTKYFTGKHGVTTFALTTQVLAESAWTPDVIERRQRVLLSVLAKLWELS